jgi:carotenoid 1,2-hydratase
MARNEEYFQVGPSNLRWHADHLEISIKERCVPLGQKISGSIRVYPEQLFHFVSPLDHQSRHHWGPIAPSARVDVTLDAPAIQWRGHAYLDSNEGTEPVIHAFKEWDWSRANMANGSVSVLYDIREKMGRENLLALQFHRDGSVTHFNAPPRHALPKAFWRVGRSIRSDQHSPPTVVQTLEDTPFYIRSVIASSIEGERVVSMHETLNIPRLDSISTRLMLPFKMPRVV